MLMKSRLTIVFLALVWPLVSLNQKAFAGGYMIPHQTARGLGLSNAMTAGVKERVGSLL